MNFHINFACDLTNTNINFINIKYILNMSGKV